jgi:GTP-binding protein
VTGTGIAELLKEVTLRLDKIPSEERRPVEGPVHIQLEPEFWVEKADPDFIVKGKKVERLVAMTNFGLPEAVERTQHILKKIGVEKALMASGARSGDFVKIGNFEFTFEP